MTCADGGFDRDRVATFMVDGVDAFRSMMYEHTAKAVLDEMIADDWGTHNATDQVLDFYYTVDDVHIDAFVLTRTRLRTQFQIDAVWFKLVTNHDLHADEHGTEHATAATQDQVEKRPRCS